MPRARRLEEYGGWYHVMNRGVAHQKIYQSQKHNNMFLKLLGEITESYSVEIHAYCLMHNHFHMLIKTPLANLSDAMRHLLGLYVRRYNLDMRRDGPLFKGRFHSTYIENSIYLLEVSRYIHLNPLRANLVKKPEEYYCSSYAAYINRAQPKDWLYRDYLLQHFEVSSKYLQYEKYVLNTVVDNQVGRVFQRKKWPEVLTNSHVAKTPIFSKDVPICKPRVIPMTMEKVLKVISEYYQLETSMLLKPRPGQHNNPKAVAMLLLRSLGQYSLSKIASKFGNISASSVSSSIQNIKKARKLNSEIADQINQIILRLQCQD